MSSNDNNNSNNNKDQPKPSSKGKGREQDTSAHGWGKMTIEDWTWKPDPLTQPVPGPTHVGPSTKWKRHGLTHSQKRNHDEAAEEAYNNAISDDEIMKDLAGEAPAHAEGLCYMLTLSEADDSDIVNTTTGNDDIMMGAPPSLRSKSAEQHLKPPTWAEPSSSMSSRTNKHPRERSPKRTQPQQRARYNQPHHHSPQPHYPPPRCRSPSPRHQSPPRHRSPSPYSRR